MHVTRARVDNGGEDAFDLRGEEIDLVVEVEFGGRRFGECGRRGVAVGEDDVEEGAGGCEDGVGGLWGDAEEGTGVEVAG